jgi:hypothetical protein
VTCIQQPHIQHEVTGSTQAAVVDELHDYASEIPRHVTKNFPKSFETIVGMLSSFMVPRAIVYYCPCENWLYYQENENDELCSACGKSRSLAKSFIYFPIKDRIRQIFQSPVRSDK